MPTQLTHVRPGDVITADQWNFVVDAINGLLQPATAANGAAINVTVPAGTADEPLRVAAPLQIIGQNFGYTLGLTTVTFVGPSGRTQLTAANLDPGSSDIRLLLTVPSIPGVTATSTNITLEVSNGASSTSLPLQARAVVPTLIGDIFVDWRADIANPAPNPLASNAAAEFAFQLTAATNQRATFALSVDIPNASAAIPSGLVSSIEFRDESGQNVITQRSVDLQPSEVRNLRVRIPLLPANWDNVSFSLSVLAVSGGVRKGVIRSFTVGATVAASDSSIHLQETGSTIFNTQTGVQETDPANGVLDGANIRLRADRQLIIDYNVLVDTAGTYDITMLPKAGTSLTGWNPDLADTAATLVATRNNDQTSHAVSVSVTPSANATATGTVVFTLKRRGATLESSKEYAVQLIT